jgi:predicted Fe-Mo cluster-binding NifX family protein
MKIAIASTNGTEVNQHFVLADKFYIFEKKNGKTNFIETRKAPDDLQNMEMSDIKLDRLKKVINIVEDCNVIYSLKIGDEPAKHLKEKGIFPLTYSGPVDKLLKNI